MLQGPHQITTLLEDAAAGDASALDEVFSRLYPELVRVAHAQRRHWQGAHTLNTTALVHEAYMKLCRQAELHVESRVHFFAVAARVMRHLLVNYAERQRASKRGGACPRISLAEDLAPAFDPIAPDAAVEFLELNRALQRLERLDPRLARVVECRFFVGLSIADTAQALGVSAATVKRDWSLARAWLYRALGGASAGGGGPSDGSTDAPPR